MEYDRIINTTPLVLVEFFATWCPHCQRMMPVVGQIKEALSDAVDVYQLDIDLNDDEAQTMKVEIVPTFIIYKDGREVWRRSGETDKEEILSVVRSCGQSRSV